MARSPTGSASSLDPGGIDTGGVTRSFSPHDCTFNRLLPLPHEQAADDGYEECGAGGGAAARRPRTSSVVLQASGRPVAETKAEIVLRRLAPRSAGIGLGPVLYNQQVRTAADLAMLDKDDLRELGLTMGERSRVLQWARDFMQRGGGASGNWPSVQNGSAEGQSGYGSDALPEQLDEAEEEGDQAVRRRLEAIEDQGDFWCSLVATAKPPQVPLRHSPRGEGAMSDVRENVLEAWFDLTRDSVDIVYQDMLRDGCGRVSLHQLGQGLQRCGMPGLSEEALAQILGGSVTECHLQRAGFELILSRLKLAQLMVFRASGDMSPPGTSIRLTVADYNAHGASIMRVTDERFRSFFFGHRPRLVQLTHGQVVPGVRWVHLRGFDLTLLLMLTVKYGLHPLGVEDIHDQAPAKIEQYGLHHFMAMLVLSVGGSRDGLKPVKVYSHHVSVFCVAAPLSDSIISVTQHDRSFKNEWPGFAESGALELGDAWVGKLRQRLEAHRSRLRERRADFLLHQILDLCADSLVEVKHAFTRRIWTLEEQLVNGGARSVQPSWLSEVSLIRQQLAVLSRRLRGLQRVLRHCVEHPELGAEFPGYFQDVKEHVEEANDDVLLSAEKCRSLMDSYEKAIERHSHDRLNSTLFVLTVATTIMSPMQFLAGVYGMNFVSGGVPSIPELRWEYGYLYFWIVVLVYLAASSAVASVIFFRWHRTAAHNPWRGRASQATESGPTPWMGDGRGSKVAASATAAPTRASTLSAASPSSTAVWLADPLLPRPRGRWTDSTSSLF